MGTFPEGSYQLRYARRPLSYCQSPCLLFAVTTNPHVGREYLAVTRLVRHSPADARSSKLCRTHEEALSVKPEDLFQDFQIRLQPVLIHHLQYIQRRIHDFIYGCLSETLTAVPQQRVVRRCLTRGIGEEATLFAREQQRLRVSQAARSRARDRQLDQPLCRRAAKLAGAHRTPLAPSHVGCRLARRCPRRWCARCWCTRRETVAALRHFRSQHVESLLDAAEICSIAAVAVRVSLPHRVEVRGLDRVRVGSRRNAEHSVVAAAAAAATAATRTTATNLGAPPKCRTESAENSKRHVDVGLH